MTVKLSTEENFEEVPNDGIVLVVLMDGDGVVDDIIDVVLIALVFVTIDESPEVIVVGDIASML